MVFSTFLAVIAHQLTQPFILILAFTVYCIYQVFYQLVLWPYFLSPLRLLPGPPLGNPLQGQFPTILEEEAGVPQRRWLKKYGPVVRVVGPIGIERLIFVKAEALQQILVSDWLDFPRPDFYRHVLGLVVGYGLFTVTGNEHKMMRKTMGPAFAIPNLMAQTELCYDIIDEYVDVLNSEIDAEPSGRKVHLIHNLMTKLTLDVLCLTAFGYKSNNLRQPKGSLAEAYEELLDLQSGPNIASFCFGVSIPFVPAFMTSGFAHLFSPLFRVNAALHRGGVTAETMHRIRVIAERMLDERIAELEAAPFDDAPQTKDLMSIILQSRSAEKAEGYQSSTAEMVDHILTFLGAGHDTTASSLTWTLWLLAKDKAAQAKLREEVTALVAENSRPDYRSLKESPFLEAVIMESLRLFPPLPQTVRQAAKDTEVDGIFVPKGTLIYVPVRVFNTWEEYWGDDAEEFRPERWENLPETYNSAFSMLAFIAGPHACIGRTMAMMEMKAVLAILIARFEFDLIDPNQVAIPRAGVSMKPTDCLPLRITKITK
ncbi:cytochrome P450 [Leucogyrophana mollusca]|uniref:Cytochrome P450 n=1 Tax=Leucogyrophana mollusca TaxID=85980 RepID=A0ACB8BQL3_9AGAM|nr:cytochrome P450 [Leucogyrophana mollusca]